MPELVIKYNHRRTLDALMDFAKYFDISVVKSAKTAKQKELTINGVTITPAYSSIDTSESEIIGLSAS